MDKELKKRLEKMIKEFVKDKNAIAYLISLIGNAISVSRFSYEGDDKRIEFFSYKGKTIIEITNKDVPLLSQMNYPIEDVIFPNINLCEKKEDKV